MRKALVTLVVLALAPNAMAQTWFNGSLDEALAAAKRDHKFVLVDFTQDG